MPIKKVKTYVSFQADNSTYFCQNLYSWKKDQSIRLKEKLMGYHKGIHLYTIGQRKGLNIPYKEPLYVIETRPDENCLVVGSKSQLVRKTHRYIDKSSVGYLS